MISTANAARPARITKLKQRRSRETRERLVQTALKLWSERGFDEVSVDAVCAETGIAKGTFYFYFPSKEHLLVDLFLDGVDALPAVVDPLIDDGASVEVVMDAIAASVAAGALRMPQQLVQRAAVETLHVSPHPLVSAHGSVFRALVSRAFAAAEAAGDLDPEYRRGELAAVLNWVVLQAIINWAAAQQPPDRLAPLLARRMRLVVRGARRNSP